MSENLSMHEKHMLLIDAVNNAKTKQEHWDAGSKLQGWRQGVRDCGREPDLCAADLEQFERGHENRPMCCGVFLDWEEAKPTGKEGV